MSSGLSRPVSTTRRHVRGPPSCTLKSNAYNSTRRSRSALTMTDTELNVIPALAMIGLSRIPKTGYSTPAAMGTPSAL